MNHDSNCPDCGEEFVTHEFCEFRKPLVITPCVMIAKESLDSLLREQKQLRESLTMAQERCGKLHARNVELERILERKKAQYESEF